MESSGPNCTKSDVPAIDNSTPIKAMFNMSLNGSSSASKSLNSSASKQSKGGSKAKKNLLNSTLKSNKSSTVIAAHVMDLNENERRLSGRNLINSRDEDNFDSGKEKQNKNRSVFGSNHGYHDQILGFK